MKRKIRCYGFNPKRFTKYSIGGLWNNEKKMNPEHPDLMGELDIPEVLIDDLVSQYKSKGKAKISLAGYKNTSKDGESYLTLTGKLPKAIEKTDVTK